MSIKFQLNGCICERVYIYYMRESIEFKNLQRNKDYDYTFIYLDFLKKNIYLANSCIF